MNVKEINPDPPLGIKAYFITSIVLFVATLLLLGLSASVTRYRHSKLIGKDTILVLLLNKLLFVNARAGNSKGYTRQRFLKLFHVTWRPKWERRAADYEAGLEESETESGASREEVEQKGDGPQDVEVREATSTAT
jgi:hypothetical protein